MAFALLLTLVASQTTVGAAQPVGLRVWTETSLRKVFRGDTPLPPRPTSLALAAAAGESESGQVVVRSATGVSRLTARVAELQSSDGHAISGGNVELFWVRYLQVRVPSQNRVAEPGSWPDPLVPVRVQPTVDVSAEQNQPLWVTVRADSATPAGLYAGRIELTSAEGSIADVPLTVRVVPVVMPAERTMHATGALYYAAAREWLNKRCRAEDKQYAEDSAEWLEVKRRYYDLLLNYRICAYELPVPLGAPEADAYLTDPRVHSVRLPWALDDPEKFEPLIAKLRRLGVLHKAFYYQADEPVPQQHEGIRELGRKLHAYEPQLPHLVTHRPVESLFGAVDIWCPNIGDANSIGHLDLAELADRRRHGERTWWYTCCVPTHPYPTWLVDDDALCPRAFCWMMALHGIEGFVYSMVHGWGEDPFAHVTSFATTNGDGLLVYPGEVFGAAEPFPSIRLMLLRDGIEDFELLRLLSRESKRVARRLGAATVGDQPVEALCRTFIRSLTDFDREPAALARARALLLKQLVSLRQAPEAVASATALSVEGLRKRVRIAGVAERLSWIRVNGQRVEIDRRGRFTHETVVPGDCESITVSVRARRRQNVLTLPLTDPPPPPPPPPSVDLPRAAAPPVLDGKLDEPCWANAAVIPLERQKNGVSPASVGTTARLTWHGDRLFVAFAARLFSPEAYADRDNLKKNWVGLRLDPGVTHDGYFFLVMTAKGNIHREVRSRLGRELSDVPLLQSEAVVQGNQLTVEAAVSLVNLFEGDPAGQQLGLNLLRQSRDELDAWRSPPDDVTQFGVVRLAAE